MHRTSKLAVTVALLAAAIGGVGFALANLTSQPITVDYTSSPGQPVNVTMQTVGVLRARHPRDLGVVHDPFG